ncbi:MAG: class I SAM-dependent methyltransferase [Acidobacteriota bacterium]|nr:class I SAM-dependent methyltransferase [Acidobacteriota bacterium]
MPTESSKTLPSNEEWKAWGQCDPLYGVATIPEHRRTGPNPWTDKLFYELGAADWKFFAAKWEQYGLGRGSCVEIGCGAGRLTIHLAKDFALVHALDVSSSMIEYARNHAPANVCFHLTNGLEIPLPTDSVNAVFSAHVLQHLSSINAAADYFTEMKRVLVPGGSLMIHVPIVAWPRGLLSGMLRFIYRAKSIVEKWHVQLRRAAFRLQLTNTPPMQIIWFETTWLYETLANLGFSNIEIRVVFGGSKMAIQNPFVFATKADQSDPT